MPTDWDQLERDLDAAIRRSARRTSDKLASAAAALTRLTEAEIKELFPRPADLQKLQRLMSIVHAARDDNAKAAELVENIEDLAGTVVKLLRRLA